MNLMMKTYPQIDYTAYMGDDLERTVSFTAFSPPDLWHDRFMSCTYGHTREFAADRSKRLGRSCMTDSGEYGVPSSHSETQGPLITFEELL